jgi:hypothetical protein
MASTSTISFATRVYNSTPSNGSTVVVGVKTYTFQDTLTNVDGNVKVGASGAASMANLYAAVNLAAGSGTGYAAATTANTRVKAVRQNATTGALTFSARTPGEIGNTITVAGDALEGGAGDVDAFARGVMATSAVNSEVAAELQKLLAVETT